MFIIFSSNPQVGTKIKDRSAMVGQPVGQPWSVHPFRQGRALLPTAGDLAESMVLSERMDSKRTNFLGQFFRQSHTYRFNIYIYMVSSGRRLGFQPFFHLLFFQPCLHVLLKITVHNLSTMDIRPRTSIHRSRSFRLDRSRLLRSDLHPWIL